MASWMQVALDLRRLRTECTLSVSQPLPGVAYTGLGMPTR